MANTRTESHIPGGVALLLVAAGDHRVRLLELLQPDDTVQVDVVEPGPSARAIVNAQQHSLYLIDETAAGDFELPHARDDGRPAPPMVLLTDGSEPQLSLDGDTIRHLLPWNLLNRASLTIAIGGALRWYATAEARAGNERELKFHLDSLPYPTTVWRRAGADLRLTAVNRAAQTLTDGRLGALVGRLAGDIFSHRPDIVAVMRDCLETGCTRRYEGPFLMRTKNEERYLIKTYAFVPPDMVIGHTEDITERKRAEAALVDREREFHALFEHAKDAILITDSDARLVNANPSALALLGVDLDRLRTMRVSDLSVVDLQGFEDVWTQFLTAGYEHGRIQIRRSDGALRTVDYAATAHFAPNRHLSIMRDVTDRVELERELQHVQRLDSVGRLAGGIAHDFNNLLTAILGFADLLLDTFPADDPRRDDMREVQRAAQSAAALTRQLLAFSRKQVLQAVVFDLNDHIAGVVGLLRRLLGDAIVVRTQSKVRRLRITADPTQLEQILLNLCINARDAMPIGGSLEIATDRVTFDAGAVRDGVKIVPGAYARLVVSDTGHGMSADTLGHLFEPFFTTKSRGNGTGLGLATVYGIVKQSGGYIWASSAIGAGTSFELLFPESTATSSVPSEEGSAPADPEEEPTTVLVVDDDRAVRALVARTLEREGFTVVQAGGTTEAIHQFSPSIALLVTDIVMPIMSGVTLARTLLARRPDLKVLLMSGYAADALDQYGSLPGSGEVLAKPFSPDALIGRVLGALGRHTG